MDEPVAPTGGHDVTYGRQPGGFGPDAVGSHPASASPFGVQDLSGNVWEWTVSAGPSPEPVNRGGCWYFGTLSALVPNREFSEASHRDPLLAPVKGVFAAQEIKPQARVLAADRGIDCVTVDYAVLKGTDDPTQRLF